MSNRNVPFFRDYLKVLGACVSYVEAARRLNISEDWVYRNLKASKAAASIAQSEAGQSPSVFLFEAEEGDGEPQWFHEHVRAAISNSIEAIEAAARNRALHGTFTTAKFQGQTVYKRDPGLIGKPELVEMLGLSDDLLRDAKGNLVPEQVWTPPSTDLVLAILAAHSKRYRKQSTVDVNMKGGGVIAIPMREEPAKVAAPLPVLQIIEDERPPTDELPPADFADIEETSDEPEPEETAPAPEPVSYSVPTPPEYLPAVNPLIAPRNGRPLSDSERDLLSRLPSTTNRAPK